MNEEQHRQKLGVMLMGLAGNFGDTFDSSTLQMWNRMFKNDGITLEQIQNAAERIMRTRKISKMPTYAEFLEFIQGSSEGAAHNQADIVIEFLRRHGRMKKPAFEDPITSYLMSFRWPYQQWAANVKEDALVWWRKDFIQAYQGYAKSPEKIPTERQIQAGAQVASLTADIGGTA